MTPTESPSAPSPSPSGGGRTRWPGKAGSAGALVWRRAGFVGCGRCNALLISAGNPQHDDAA